jgi:lysophospholipase L1-like esterase
MNMIATDQRAANRTIKWRSLLLNCSLILFGLTIPLVFGEIVARLTHAGMAQFDDHLFRRSAWSFRPNSHQDSYIGAPVYINNLGLRGPDTTLAKPPGVFRIIGVGDSITFGYGVRVEDTFLKVLEQDLNDSARSNLRYEVLNAGDPSTGFEYYTHFIEHDAQAMHPDLIVVCMALNDIDPLLEPEPREPQAALSVSGRINGLLLMHSYLYDILYVQGKSLAYRLNILHLKDNDGFGFLAIEPPSPAQDKARAAINQYIHRIVNFTRLHHERLAIVVVPVEPQLSERALKLYADQLHLYFGPEVLVGQPQRWVEQIGANYGVPVLDLLPALRAGDDGKLFLRNRSITFDPVHLSPAGHRLAGDAIARFLKSPAVDLVP